ncbi:hypothetical protein CDEST_15392 [Colletotrichum destructivum]|uniref:Uncharacterized protein n=1 Tax=Colletotrichum destructivum TaxID=34406 RepID=A0AAX4J4T1_9PEZI|nr:hypothetical protein CDEST_15392 [Colletotrichum destructivum]
MVPSGHSKIACRGRKSSWVVVLTEERSRCGVCWDQGKYVVQMIGSHSAGCGSHSRPVENIALVSALS